MSWFMFISFACTFLSVIFDDCENNRNMKLEKATWAVPCFSGDTQTVLNLTITLPEFVLIFIFWPYPRHMESLTHSPRPGWNWQCSRGELDH